MPTERLQISFTEDQRRRLDAAAERKGTTVAAIVSEAADAYVAGAAPAGMKAILDETFGSMSDLDVPARSEWDR